MATATEQDTLAVINKLYEVLNERDIVTVDTVASLIAEDAVWIEMPTGAEWIGPEPIRLNMQRWAEACPDTRLVITNLVVSGDQAVIEFHLPGTNTGPLHTPGGQIPATGRPIDVKMIEVVKIANGKAVSGRTYYDLVSTLGEFGLMPEVTRPY